MAHDEIIWLWLLVIYKYNFNCISVGDLSSAIHDLSEYDESPLDQMHNI